MGNRILLAVGVGAIVLAFVGPALAGAFIDGESPSWRPFGQMHPGNMGGHMGGMMGGYPDDFGSADVPPAIADAAGLAVTLRDFSISPSDVVVEEGRPTNITVTNEGAAPHDFTVPDLGIQIQVAPGDTVTAGIGPQVAGTYDTLCTVPGHESLGMVGRFTVQSTG